MCGILPHGGLPEYLRCLGAVTAARWGTTIMRTEDEAGVVVCVPVGADVALVQPERP